MSEEKKNPDVELDDEALQEIQGGAQLRRRDEERLPWAPKRRLGGRPQHPGQPGS